MVESSLKIYFIYFYFIYFYTIAFGIYLIYLKINKIKKARGRKKWSLKLEKRKNLNMF